MTRNGDGTYTYRGFTIGYTQRGDQYGIVRRGSRKLWYATPEPGVTVPEWADGCIVDVERRFDVCRMVDAVHDKDEGAFNDASLSRGGAWC